MTKEEALKTWLPIISMSIDNIPELKEAFDMAVKALEQEPILDKIQGDIERVVTVCHASNNHDELIRRNVVLQILDKYKAEREGKQN